MDSPTSQAPPNGKKLAILGAGHLGTGLAAHLTRIGHAVTLYAQAAHLGVLRHLPKYDNVIKIKTDDQVWSVQLTATTDLAAAVAGVEAVFIVTRSDGHEAFVVELEKLDLTNIDIYVICGQGFTMGYHERLNAKRIIEITNSPAAVKLIDDNEVVNIKKWKGELEATCFPIPSAGELDLPSDVKDTLSAILPAKFVPIPVLEAAFQSNYITHALPSVANLGLIKEDRSQLTATAQGYLKDLDQRDPPRDGFFFYGRGQPKHVTDLQEKMDEERRAVARAYGLTLKPLLKECNDEYNTDHQNLREFTSYPNIHNVQHACPNGLDHRYFLEEIWPIMLIVSLAKHVGVKVPLTKAVMNIIKAIHSDKSFDTPRSGYIRSLKPEELVQFGARF